MRRSRGSDWRIDSTFSSSEIEEIVISAGEAAEEVLTGEGGASSSSEEEVQEPKEESEEMPFDFGPGSNRKEILDS